jgi:1-acyl-sn-glycerol-3-phosphate acyltransferase
LIFYAISQVKITGKENVPPQGAYLVAVNHVSLYEAPLICAFWPIAPEALGAADIWERPGQSILARLYGGIPVHRGTYDRHLIETSLTVLRSGYPLAIAPEGERSHTPGMQRAQVGIAYLMEKARVPVVPVGIVGSTDDFLTRALHGERPTIEMQIGKPIRFPAIKARGTARREILQQNADAVMQQIAILLPLEYRGYYRDYVNDNRETHQ